MDDILVVVIVAMGYGLRYLDKFLTLYKKDKTQEKAQTADYR